MSLEGDLIFVFPSTERGAKVGGLWIGSSLWHSSEVLFSRGRFHYCWVFSRFKITLLHICLWVLNSFVGAYNHYITATVQAEMWLMFYVMAKSSINSYSDEVLLIFKKCFFSLHNNSPFKHFGAFLLFGKGMTGLTKVYRLPDLKVRESVPWGDSWPTMTLLIWN